MKFTPFMFNLFFILFEMNSKECFLFFLEKNNKLFAISMEPLKK